jgi:D-sedoheptulose 7-phosphate isomerase
MSIFEKATREAFETLQSLPPLQSALERAAEIVGAALTRGGKLLVCGNGGSAADGADFATEFACRFITDRQPYPALNLSSCGSLLTATGNDYGFDEIFARQVRAFGKPGDVLVALTTSGNSPNILAALNAAKSQGLHTIALLGRDGGRARGLAEVELLVPSQITARTQEAHKFLLHVLCEIVEIAWLLPREATKK